MMPIAVALAALSKMLITMAPVMPMIPAQALTIALTPMEMVFLMAVITAPLSGKLVMTMIRAPLTTATMLIVTVSVLLLM